MEKPRFTGIQTTSDYNFQ